MDGRASNELLHRDRPPTSFIRQFKMHPIFQFKHTMLNEVHEENPSTAKSEMRRRTFSVAEGKMARSGAPPHIDTLTMKASNASYREKRNHPFLTSVTFWNPLLSHNYGIQVLYSANAVQCLLFGQLPTPPSVRTLIMDGPKTNRIWKQGQRQTPRRREQCV